MLDADATDNLAQIILGIGIKSQSRHYA